MSPGLYERPPPLASLRSGDIPSKRTSWGPTPSPLTKLWITHRQHFLFSWIHQPVYIIKFLIFADWVLKTEQSVIGDSLSYLDMMERTNMEENRRARERQIMEEGLWVSAITLWTVLSEAVDEISRKLFTIFGESPTSRVWTRCYQQGECACRRLLWILCSAKLTPLVWSGHGRCWCVVCWQVAVAAEEEGGRWHELPRAGGGQGVLQDAHVRAAGPRGAHHRQPQEEVSSAQCC